MPFFPQLPAVNLLPFPAATTRADVGSQGLPTPFTFGWMFLDLNNTIAGVPNPPEDPAAAQAWVTQLHDANGRFSVGYAAVQLDSATQAAHFIPGH